MLLEMFRWHPVVLVNYCCQSPCLADTLSLMSYKWQVRQINNIYIYIYIYIYRCHRVGKRSRDKERQILCKFKSYKPRSVVFSAKKSAQAGVFISEDLTAKKSNLLYKARILRREGKIKQCWSYNGRIYIKMKDDTSKVVYNEAYMLDKNLL